MTAAIIKLGVIFPSVKFKFFSTLFACEGIISGLLTLLPTTISATFSTPGQRDLGKRQDRKHCVAPICPLLPAQSSSSPSSKYERHYVQ